MKNEIKDKELFNMGVFYIKEKVVSDAYEIIQYIKPPLVPQFVLKKNGEIFFLYIKVERNPFEIEDVFNHTEIQGYMLSCEKRDAKLLLAGIVFSNGTDASKPINKQDKIEIDFTGIINMQE